MAQSPSICPALLYEDASAAIEQLTKAFGFARHAVYEDKGGRVVHAELTFGNGMVMLGSKGTGGEYDKLMADAGPMGVFVHVDDVDAHHARAVEQGAEIVMAPRDQDYGSRDYMARDVEGNLWSFGTYEPAAEAAET
ncbi:VOC family protein [Streptomyces sp. MUM 178J]|uniref:VOC family protein n=1 Tax=Streptomyces sp. MUM 178J TaxID=2791991 RepID=UPI001F04F29B|nr:VOC family protein [Streptomyces sp. MUM 178J]WRQ78790.1 VOC family protein [Streptomyces sp. MUM 178J]